MQVDPSSSTVYGGYIALDSSVHVGLGGLRLDEDYKCLKETQASKLLGEDATAATETHCSVLVLVLARAGLWCSCVAGALRGLVECVLKMRRGFGSGLLASLASRRALSSGKRKRQHSRTSSRPPPATILPAKGPTTVGQGRHVPLVAYSNTLKLPFNFVPTPKPSDGESNTSFHMCFAYGLTHIVLLIAHGSVVSWQRTVSPYVVASTTRGRPW